MDTPISDPLAHLQALLATLTPSPELDAILQGAMGAVDPTKPKPVKRETTEHMQARRGERGGLTVIELEVETGWSKSTLRRMFKDEPGVSRITHPETLHRRGYECVRIPRHVADRVLARHSHQL